MTDYFNLLRNHGNLVVKTLVLTTPEQFLNYDKIVNDLIQQGHQILPHVPSPNRIEISYIEKKYKYSYGRNINILIEGYASIRFAN